MVKVSGWEGGQVVSPSGELTSFIGVGERLCEGYGVAESPAKLCVLIGDEIFAIFVSVGGGEGPDWALSCPFLVGGWGLGEPEVCDL